MKQLLGVLITLMTCGVWGSRAQAQIESHDVRLTLDASLVQWTKQTVVFDEFNGGELKGKSTAIGFLGAGSVGVGFAVNRFLIPTLFFGLQQTKLEDDDGVYATTTRQWELRPALEVAILPSLRLVPFASVGLSLARRVGKEEDFSEEVKSFGLGPAISVGVHGFVIGKASLDLSLGYRALFFGKPDASDSIDSEDLPKKQRDHSLLLNLGASFWI